MAQWLCRRGYVAVAMSQWLCGSGYVAMSQWLCRSGYVTVAMWQWLCGSVMGMRTFSHKTAICFIYLSASNSSY